MVVLVCGGRDFGVLRGWPGSEERAIGAWARTVFATEMARIHAATPIAKVVHGAASGADTLAGLWARQHGITCASYPADWSTHGRAAGPKRNARMLAEEKPDLVVAFPGGRGTADMVRRARAAGVDVLEVE